MCISQSDKKDIISLADVKGRTGLGLSIVGGNDTLLVG
jgi:hypothetical protein